MARFSPKAQAEGQLDDGYLIALAKTGEVGRAAVIPTGMAPGSDVGNMSILGYDPADHHTGVAGFGAPPRHRGGPAPAADAPLGRSNGNRGDGGLPPPRDRH